MAEPGGERSRVRIIRRGVTAAAGAAAIGIVTAISGTPPPAEAAGPTGSPTSTATPDLNQQIAADRTAAATAAKGRALAATATAVHGELNAALGTPTVTVTPTRTETATPTPTGVRLNFTQEELNRSQQGGVAIAIDPVKTEVAGKQRKADEDEFNPKLAAANAQITNLQQEAKQEKNWEPGWLESAEHIFVLGGLVYLGWKAYRHLKGGGTGHH